MRDLRSPAQTPSALVLGIGVLAACGGCGSTAPEEPVALSRAAIAGGALDVEHGAVVALAQRLSAESFALCTGTVFDVRERSALVLTAAHCVAEHDDEGDVKTPVRAVEPRQISVTGGALHERDMLLGRYFHASAISLAPGFDGFVGSPDDVAVVRISGATSALPTMQIAATAPAELVDGAAITLVGFGRTGASGDSGARRVASQTIAWSTAQFIGFDQSSGQGICSGDSGGPVILDRDGAALVVAVNSLGVEADGACTKGSATRVERFATLLADAVESVPTALDCASCVDAEAAPGNECADVVGCAGTCVAYEDCIEACADRACLVDCQRLQQGRLEYDGLVEQRRACAERRCSAACITPGAEDDGCAVAARPGVRSTAAGCLLAVAVLALVRRVKVAR